MTNLVLLIFPTGTSFKTRYITLQQPDRGSPDVIVITGIHSLRRELFIDEGDQQR
jgi:hypothetical protein